MKAYESLKTVSQALPPGMRNGVLEAAQRNLNNLQEIRLRINRPVMLCFTGGFVPTDFIATRADINAVFSALCGFSVYSKQHEIVCGYITLKGGSRAGLCGTAVFGASGLMNIRDLSSISLRVSPERPGCSDKIIKVADPLGGILLCGSPCSGKTTLLRDLCRTLSQKYRLSLIDTRGEIAGTYGGVPQNDVGMSDVLDCYPRGLGFDHALRCLSPEIIACDELGTGEDSALTADAALSGVSVIATAHARTPDELRRRPVMREILRQKAFGTVVFLKDSQSPGEIAQVIGGDELA